MGELFRLELGRGRFRRRTRNSGSLKRNCSCWSSSMTVMKNGEDFLGTLVENFLEIRDLVSVIASLRIFERHKIFGDIRNPMLVLLELF